MQFLAPLNPLTRSLGGVDQLAMKWIIYQFVVLSSLYQMVYTRLAKKFCNTCEKVDFSQVLQNFLPNLALQSYIRLTNWGIPLWL